jgi:hypothetical protein
MSVSERAWAAGTTPHRPAAISVASEIILRIGMLLKSS